MLRSDMPPSTAAMPAGASARMLCHLGMLYCLGHEVEQDYVAAQKWFSIAAFMGSTEARHYRCQISRAMTASQIAEAQSQAWALISLN